MGLIYYAYAECPDRKKHTKAPSGYLQWHEWAAKKSRTHEQHPCPTCGFYMIWKPKKKNGT